MAEEVIVEIGAEDNASQTIEQVAGKTEEFGDRAAGGAGKAQSGFSKFGSTLKSMTPIVLGVGAAIVGGLALAVNAARGAEEQMARVDAILRTMGEAGSKAKSKILEVSGSLVKLGFDDEDAAESMAKLFQRTKDVTEAQDLLSLSADLARAKQMDLGSATDLVGQVLAGNGRVLKQFGIDIKDAATPMEALAELQKKVAGQSEAYANTFNGQMDRLKVVWGNLLEEIGAPLLGFLTKALDGFLDWIEAMGGTEAIIAKLKPVIETLLPVLQAMWEAVQFLATFMIQAITDIDTMWSNNMYHIRDIVTFVWEAIKLTLTTTFNIIKGLFKIFGGALTLDWQLMWDGIKTMLTAGGEFLSKAWNAIMEGLSTVASKVWEGIKETFKAAINWLIDKFNVFIRAVSGVANIVGKAVGQKNWSIDSIPHLASGGVVTRPTLAMIGEAGPEAIVPLGRKGGASAGLGVTIVIQGNSFYGDDERFVQKIGDQIMRMLEPHLQFATS